jgi:hypothetical protein
MKRLLIVGAPFLIVAAPLSIASVIGCGSGSSGTGSTPDGSANDSSAPPAEAESDSAPDTSMMDSPLGLDSSDAATVQADADAELDAGADAGDAPSAPEEDAACAASWTVVPTVDPLIALPDGGAVLLIHVAGVGTQNYECTESTTDGGDAGDAGPTFAWVFTGPQANLDDCDGQLIGHHFASEGGPGEPEWMTLDNSYVIGKKVNAGVTVDGGDAIPWLLLQAIANADAGLLSQVTYVQRVNTTGGLAPAASTCDAAEVGTTQKVAYTADYYFYGP